MNVVAPGIELTAVSGGIGSGKSVVCRILTTAGYAVYNCDVRAKALMDDSDTMLDAIAADICHDAVTRHPDGQRVINRPLLAEAVFNDGILLEKLNALVHGAVRADILMWHDELRRNDYNRNMAFIETAILYQSGIHKMVDRIWEIEAPHDIRIQRAMRRDNSTRQQIEARIRSQERSAIISKPAQIPVPFYIIRNDGDTPLLPQLLAFGI